MKTAITRALSLLLVCVLVLAMGIMSIAAEDAIPGDVNNDGELTILDALFIVKAVTNQTALENSDVNGDGKTNLLDILGVIKLIATGEAPEVGDEDKNTADIVVENGTVKEAVSINGENVSAAVPEGVAVNEGTTELTLTVSALDNTAGNITVGEDDEVVSYDVHIDGVSEENTVAIVVDLGAILPAGQNAGTVALYHVEHGITREMTQVMTLAELDEHNEFYYYPATGNVYVAMATFSEVSAVTNSVNPWDGTIDHTWYKADATSLTIANADQLASFAQIVGGMASGIEQDDFNGKTVTLISDINLGDKESENNPDIIFYPIGYYNNLKSYEKESGVSVTSSVSSFEGTFDGAGHTIANFYQNTWEMFGDYNSGYSGTPNHYKDAMGLFGYVLNGTVKNLTVKNFSSDGEFTPTGVIAAYSDNSTFENIAIVNCNPRVYNTGNGGIVGIGGTENGPDTDRLVFENITIDNTNKITALWGSWDVACGGLIGMFRGPGHVDMTNCHVAAQIDVYNDVCGNYQYYWYRYAGMLIGTNFNMITDANGYTVPETDKFHAEGCTVHFDTWNDYYYCELVANSLASYTHDHQFSRLEVIDSDMQIKNTDGSWSKAGNFIVLDKDGDNHTCYHIVNKNGELVEHTHESAGTEVVNGETVLKENNQCVYLPFNQLFTGYGWGVKHVPIYDETEQNPFKGVTIRDREYTDSVLKFTGEDKYYTSGMTVKASNLFKAIANPKIELDADNVIVSVTPAANSKASATVTHNADWKETTIEFAGTGNLMIAIQDYYFCSPTIINVTVLDGEYYHIDADGTSNIEWQKSGSEYKLVCTKCDKVLKTSADPVVYLDHAGKVDGTSNFSLGIDAAHPVRTLAEASKRVTETGGTITLASDIQAPSTGLNNPKDTSTAGVSNKMTAWKETVTFSGDKDGDGDADYGFDIVSHGSPIYFDGPTKFEKLIIDGRATEENNSDGGNYNIAVFAANWNDFTFGEGIVAHSPFYFVVGNHFYRTGGVVDQESIRLYIEAFCGAYDYLVRDTLDDLEYYENGNRYTTDLLTDGEQRTVNIVFNKIECDATCPVVDDEGNVIDEVPVEAYDRVYLGTRNRTFDDLTVKNVHVDVTSNDAAFNLVYAGSTGGTYKRDENGNKTDGSVSDDADILEVVDVQMNDCSLDIEFNGSNAGAYTRFFRVGNNNTGNSGTAYLDELDLALNGTFYINDTSDEENKDNGSITDKAFLVNNVIDADVTVSSSNNEMGITFRLYNTYKETETGKTHNNIAKFTYGSHSFLKEGVTPYTTSGYTGNNTFAYEVDYTDCEFSDWTVNVNNTTEEIRTCSVCRYVDTRDSENKTHEHTNTVLTGTKDNFTLTCAECNEIIPMYKQPETAVEHDVARPVIYVDVQKSVNTAASDQNFGFDEDNAVATLGAAVSRLKETGGTIKLMSNVVINSNSFNHPFTNTYNLPAWEKEITFSSCYTKNNEATVGFKIAAHGAQIYFSGPAKLKNILIDGRTEELNNQVNAYYYIPVFVSNWYSFAVSTGVVAYGECYFVSGNYFANHTLADYAEKGIPYFSKNIADEFISERSEAISVNLYPITEKPVKFKDGSEKAATAYGIIFLGNRDKSTVAAGNQYTCTTKNTQINFVVNENTTIDSIIVGSYDERSTADHTYNLVTNSKVYLTFNDNSVVKRLSTGVNFDRGEAYLDTLSIRLNDKARFDCGNANNIVVDVYNAKNVTFYAETAARNNDSKNVGRIVFDKSTVYTGTGSVTARFGTEDFERCTNADGYNDYGYPVFDEDLYKGGNNTYHMVKNCDYNGSAACTECGITQAMVTSYRNFMEKDAGLNATWVSDF